MRTKIKILMVMGNTRMGGTQALILNILRNIDLSKFQIDFAINFYAENDGIEGECKKYGSNFYILPYFKIWNFISFKKKWEHFLSSHNYDIIYAHSTNSASIFLKMAKSLGIKTISHSHSSGYRGGIFETIAKKYFAKGVKKVADYWFACSDKAALRLYGEKYKSYPHYYEIPNAIDVNQYRFDQRIRTQIRETLGLDDDIFLIGHIGTFSAPKNHKFLIDIFNDILKTNPKSRLICCGSGILMPSIKIYASSLGILNKIIFSGVVTNVNEYMMAMDAFVFPSLFEGFGISILEAQSSGLPVVMSDTIPTNVDLTDLIDRCSLTESSNSWAKRILKINRRNNREIYNEYIAKTQYNITSVIQKFEELFTTLVNS